MEIIRLVWWVGKKSVVGSIYGTCKFLTWSEMVRAREGENADNEDEELPCVIRGKSKEDQEDQGTDF